MGNCACEKTQQVQSNIANFPPQVLDMFNNLKQQAPIDIVEEFDLRERDQYIKQLPNSFRPMVQPIQNLKQFEYQEFLKDVPIKGPSLMEQDQRSYIYYGQMNNKSKKGNGIIISAEGSYYQGQWSDNNPHGFGRMVNELGEIYEGQWIFGCIEGDGVQYRQNLIQKGIWIEGELNGLGDETLPGEYTYKGSFKNGQKQGKGEIKFENGDIYQGDFQNNQIQGIGKYLWAEGQIYDGNWVESQMHGKGVYTFPDGTKFEGFYHMGERHGKVTGYQEQTQHQQKIKKMYPKGIQSKKINQKIHKLFIR